MIEKFRGGRQLAVTKCEVRVEYALKISISGSTQESIDFVSIFPFSDYNSSAYFFGDCI
jgi:hypothetical protein